MIATIVAVSEQTGQPIHDVFWRYFIAQGLGLITCSIGVNLFIWFLDPNCF